MAHVKGTPRTGGRKPGTPNKSTVDLKERLRLLKCDYVGYLANTVNNEVPCATCRGKGKTKFQPGNSDHPGVRTCQSCWGSGMERISPAASQDAAKTLLEYCEAKRKALEVSGSAEKPPIGVRVVLVDAPKRIESNGHAGD